MVKDFVASTKGRLQIFFLPPYSLELNPDEWVWKNVKHDRTKRTVPLSKGHLWTIVRDALLWLQGTPERVMAFFGDPHLVYIRAQSRS